MLLYWCTGFLMDLRAFPRPVAPLVLECWVAREAGGTASTWGGAREPELEVRAGHGPVG